jgi:hypothetical protein
MQEACQMRGEGDLTDDDAAVPARSAGTGVIQLPFMAISCERQSRTTLPEPSVMRMMMLLTLSL